jgi:hypothetical protein
MKYVYETDEQVCSSLIELEIDGIKKMPTGRDVTIVSLQTFISINS